MSKSPPGVKRVVAVLNFFAGHPGQAFTFTDIVKALDLGRATCHALLAGLVEAQYLYRNSDKSYVIGPALVAIGKVAADQFSPLQAAIPEMRTLSDECRAICTAVYFERGNAVIRHRAGIGYHQGWQVPQGTELPLRAPFAGAFFATAKSYDVEKWLDQMSPKPSDQDREDLYSGIEFVRKYGFTFGVRNTEVHADFNAPQLAFSGEQSEFPVSLMADLNDKAEYMVGFINCPVLNEKGEVEFVINLSGFNEPVSGKRVREMGGMLRDAAERITYFINGKTKKYPFPASSGSA